MESVIGLLSSHDAATRVQAALIQSGCQREDVALFTANVQEGKAQEGLVDSLVERGLVPARAKQYAEAVAAGGVLVVAEAEKVDAALEVMNRFELVTPQSLIGQRGETVERARTVEERLHVGKQEMTGGKRLVTHVSEHVVEKPVTLHQEEVEVEHRAEDRRLSPEEAGRAFREETVEMTATSERPVVSKEARVTGEVALRKRSAERREVVRDTVRQQEVSVETLREKPLDGPRR